jgi:deoxyribose-phosphate aldolase
MADYSYRDISKMIDHALLAPQQTDAELEAGCRAAAGYQVAGVCIKPAWVAAAKRWLAETPGGADIAVGTVIGFPHGGHHTAVKLAEAKQALADGATELDMVVNIGKVLSGDWAAVEADIGAVAMAGREAGAIVKVIFENCYLQEPHKRKLCEISAAVGADFVKTSTGYGSSGATDEDLKLMRAATPARLSVKASGGVRTFDRLLEVRALGVSRVGTSSTAAILDECRKRLGLPPITSPKPAEAKQY